MKDVLYFLSLLLLGGAPAAAGPIVQSNVTPIGGGLFHFEFSITNNTIDDIALVSIGAPTSDSSIGATLLAPLGFMASYDSGLGIVDFLEGTDLFSVGTTKSGFSFNSAFGPYSGEFGNFTALTVNGNMLSGSVETTLVSVVPEPRTGALLALGLAALIGAVVARPSRSQHWSMTE